MNSIFIKCISVRFGMFSQCVAMKVAVYSQGKQIFLFLWLPIDHAQFGRSFKNVIGHLFAGVHLYATTEELPAQCQGYLYVFFYELYVIVTDPFTKARYASSKLQKFFILYYIIFFF